MAKIYVSWVDKRHVTLTSTLFKHGAECHHFTNEDIASENVTKYIAAKVSAGFQVKQLATREWVLTK